MASYVSKYTGQQIDEAVGKALNGLPGGGSGNGTVTSVNGVEPDGNGNVVIPIPSKPGDIGAEVSGTATAKVSAHNEDKQAHPDIRELISGKLDANMLPEAINTVLEQAKDSGEFDGKDGKTPVKGTDYWTSADQESIVQDVIAALGTPVFGRVDDQNNIILTGELADGTYAIKYEDAGGNVTEIGTLQHNYVPDEPDEPDEPDVPTYTNVLPSAKGEDGKPYNGTGYAVGKRINSSWNETNVANTAATSPVFLTGRIPIPAGATVRFKNCYIDTNGVNGTPNDTADQAYYGHNLSGLYGCVLYYNATSGTGNKVGTNYTWQTFANYSNLASTPSVDINGYVTEFTFNTTETMYARFVLGGDPTKAVITINEPITG